MRPHRRFGMILALAGCAATGLSLGADAPVPPLAVAAWPAGMFEVRVAFDRPLKGPLPKDIIGTVIRFDEGNRTKILTGPERTSAGGPRIAAARLEVGGRVLVLTTDPAPREAVYRLTLPSLSVDTSYDLTGVEVAWEEGGEDGKPDWSGWWPVLDPAAVRKETKGSVVHEKGLALLAKPGRISLHALVALPKGKTTLRIEADNLVEVSLNNASAAILNDPNGQHATFVFESTAEPADLVIKAHTGGGQPFRLRAVSLQDQSGQETLLSNQLVLPWAPTNPSTSPMLPPLPADLAKGGDPKNGESVFFGEQAKCAQCHKVNGKGGAAGPDLSDQWRRYRVEVYRDIFDPSAVINPDYVAYTVISKDGRIAMGTVRAEGADAIKVTGNDAKTEVIKRADIEDIRASSTSIMPVGLVGAIGEKNMRDLLAFLMAKKAGPPGAAEPTKEAPASPGGSPP